MHQRESQSLHQWFPHERECPRDRKHVVTDRDASFGWQVISDFMPLIEIRADPCVTLD